MVKVWPKNDEMRKILKHGVIAFPAEGPADWPDDTFTHRRIMDGDVTTEEPKIAPKKFSPDVKMEKAQSEAAPAEDKVKSPTQK